MTFFLGYCHIHTRTYNTEEHFPNELKVSLYYLLLYSGQENACMDRGLE